MEFTQLFPLCVFLVQNYFILFPVAINTGHFNFNLDLVTVPPVAVLLLLATTNIPWQVVQQGIIGNSLIQPYSIMILFFSLAYLALSLNRSGLLQFLAFKLATLSSSSSPASSPRRGFMLVTRFYLFGLLLSVIMGNDPIILSATGFLVHFTSASGLNPLPFLFTEFSSSNIGSMVLFCGNPTNVVICQGFQLGLLDYSLMMLIPFIGCSGVCYLISIFQFRKELSEVNGLPPSEVIQPESLSDPVAAVVGSVVFIACIVAVVVTSFFGIEIWIISLSFAVFKIFFDIFWDYMKTADYEDIVVINSTLVGKLHLHNAFQVFPTLMFTISSLPFGLLLFAFSQFVLVEALDYHNWISIFSQGLAPLMTSLFSTIAVVCVLSIFLCAVLGTNITATILLTKVLLQLSLPPQYTRAAAVSLAVGSNIGAVSFTFSASLAGLLWKGILSELGVVIEKSTFCKWNWAPLLGMSIVGFLLIYLQSSLGL